MATKLIVIEVSLMGEEMFLISECEEQDVEEDVKYMIRHDAIDIDNCDEDRPHGNINSINVYSITDKKKFDPTEIIKKMNEQSKAFWKEQEEKREKNTYERLRKKFEPKD